MIFLSQRFNRSIIKCILPCIFLMACVEEAGAQKLRSLLRWGGNASRRHKLKIIKPVFKEVLGEIERRLPNVHTGFYLSKPLMPMLKISIGTEPWPDILTRWRRNATGIGQLKLVTRAEADKILTQENALVKKSYLRTRVIYIRASGTKPSIAVQGSRGHPFYVIDQMLLLRFRDFEIQKIPRTMPNPFKYALRREGLFAGENIPDLIDAWQYTATRDIIKYASKLGVSPQQVKVLENQCKMMMDVTSSHKTVPL